MGLDYTMDLLRMTTQMTTGMPSKAVTVLIGSVSHLEIISQPSKTTAPHKAMAGSRIRWSALQKSIRAICGIANPTKPIGPQKAVTVPANRVVERNIR